MGDKNNLVDYWKTSGLIKDNRLLSAFMEIDRKNFVLAEDKNNAYEDIALNIGYNSTISQPSTIIIMLQALELKSGEKVLEIGAGSGYTSALMSKIIGNEGKIYSLDIVPELIKFADENLKKENIKNVKLFCRDGSMGLKDYAPYDKILINAACTKIPRILFDQLKINGILVAPIGEYSQKMIKFTKEINKVKEEYLGDFIFVKLR